MNKVFDSFKGETKGTVPCTGTREIGMKPGQEQGNRPFIGKMARKRKQTFDQEQGRDTGNRTLNRRNKDETQGIEL